MGKLDKALEKHRESLEIYRAIHGRVKPHPDTARSLWNIGLVYHMQKNLNQAADFLEQSLEMQRIVHGRSSKHPDITNLLCWVAEVYEDQGRRDEALAICECNNNTYETSDGDLSDRTIGYER